jgi:hypothetical protein
MSIIAELFELASAEPDNAGFDVHGSSLPPVFFLRLFAVHLLSGNPKALFPEPRHKPLGTRTLCGEKINVNATFHGIWSEERCAAPMPLPPGSTGVNHVEMERALRDGCSVQSSVSSNGSSRGRGS